MPLAQPTGLVLAVQASQHLAPPASWLQGPPMTEGQYPPAFPLKHQQKDMR